MESVITKAVDSPAPNEPTDDPGADLETTVAAYLCNHPDFLALHSEVLARLRIPHTAAGSAVSLIEHQVKILRTQLETERSRLSQLIARAREYESFATRLHTLVLALITAEDLEQVRAVLHEALMSEFSAQAVTLKLFPIDPAAADGDRDPTVAAFADFLGRKHALCGPLDEAKTAALFGAPANPQQEPLSDEASHQVHCAALVPIHAGWRSGVLAIGATNPNRFKPDMGTDFLDRLGEIVSHRLRMLPPESTVQIAAPEPEPPPPPRRRRAKKATPE
jgi:uncharacterized protein YigA (DUF484 family)